MTTAQIMALLSLLLSFGVDQPTVTQVQAILTHAPAPIVRTVDSAKILTMEDTVVGITPDGQEVYKGVTTHYIVDENGCKWSVTIAGEGFSNAQKMIWCPAK